MNETYRTVTEDELHAFADGLLAPEDRARVEAWLAEFPDDALKLAAWQAQNAGIRELFAPYETAQDGDKALVLRRPEPAHSVSTRAWFLAAAAAMIFVLGMAAGNLLPTVATRPEPQLVGIEALPRQAQSAFLVYASEVRHPVEVGADQEAHLATWLGKRLNIPDMKVPNLQTLGFQLVGGRLLPVNETPGAMFMYEDAGGKRITVLIGRNKDNETTSFRFASAGSLDTFYWIDGELGYAVTGEISRDMLRQVAELCYKQFPS